MIDNKKKRNRVGNLMKQTARAAIERDGRYDADKPKGQNLALGRARPLLVLRWNGDYTEPASYWRLLEPHLTQGQ